MWMPEVSVLELIIRGAVVYVVLFARLRFIGKKQVGELSSFDLVILLIISETVDGSLIGDDHSLTGGLISAATLVVIVQVVGYLTWRFRKIERLVEGVPRILVRHGEVNNSVMNSEQVADIATHSRHVRFTPNNGHWPAQVSIWLSVYKYTP